MKSKIFWDVGPVPLSLGADDVHVWCAFLDQLDNQVFWMSKILSSDERERAARFIFDKDRRRFIVSRGLLRVILSNYLGVEPTEFRFKYGPQGKPSLDFVFKDDYQLDFNLSHSHNFGLYAFAVNRDIGVDLELVRPLDDMDAIAKRFFSPTEFADFSSLLSSDKPRGFFNCWTRKEAYIKAIGDGLTYPLDQFDVSLIPNKPAKLLSVENSPQLASRWSMVSLEPAFGYVGALVISGCNYRLSRWQWIFTS